MSETTEYNIPSHITEYLANNGYANPFAQMRTYINQWWNFSRAIGDFWSYSETGDDGHVYKVNRMTVRPAQKVCDEWASLIISEDAQVVCEDEAATMFLADYIERTNLLTKVEADVSEAFRLGTAALAMHVNTETGSTRIRHYDARMVIPVSWDDEGVTECAFVTVCTIHGKSYDQLQIHRMGEKGYVIDTHLFDRENGKPVTFEGIIDTLETECKTPTFAIITPAIPNRCVSFSPYGMSIFAECEDVMKSVDLCYDAIMTEVGAGKLRVFMSDTLFDVSDGDKGKKYVPFGKNDATFIRQVASMGDDIIKEFAPALRINDQRVAYRTAVQTMGDRCGFGHEYFDIDQNGGMKTATEVISGNSKAARNMTKHQKVLGDAIAQICQAVISLSNQYGGENIPEPGTIRVQFDDSIIQDEAAERAQDMAEVNVTMQPWEFRMKHYGEDEETAKRNAPGSAILDDFMLS